MARWLVLLAALFAGVHPAAAQEVIERFDVDYELQRDGSLTISETIRVRAEGREIQRGILRDIPTRYDARIGETVNVGFELLDVRRDGETEPYQVTDARNGKRIRIGSPDRFLTPDSYEYQIRYRIERAVGRFEQHDEIYWNVTGSGWSFPILEARATLRLPSNAEFDDVSVYTGRQGARGDDARVVTRDPGLLVVETTGALSAYEGFTFSASFPKGVVAPLSASEALRRDVADWLPLLAALAGLMIVLAYYYHAWRKVGRDPPPGTIVPLYAPPEGMSPAAIRYVVAQGADNRAFTAALVNAAVNGHLRIERDKGGMFSTSQTRFVRLPDGPRQRELMPAEQAMLGAFIRPGETIESDNKNHRRFTGARTALDAVLRDRFDGIAFNRNIRWAVAGIPLVLLGVLLVAAAIAWTRQLASDGSIYTALGALLAGIWLLIVAPREGALRSFTMAIGILGIIAGLFVGAPLIPIAIGSGAGLPLLIPAVIGGAVALSGFFWMSAPTVEGRALLDEIAGFKQYLGTTEGERFDRMQRPEDPLHLFERFLPYAIALGVENRWAKKFESALAAAAAAPTQSMQGLYWYSGPGDVWSDPGGFATSLGSDLSHTIASASTAPSQSSGIGGGGFSGGGGGGGGGGGW